MLSSPAAQSRNATSVSADGSNTSRQRANALHERGRSAEALDLVAAALEQFKNSSESALRLELMRDRLKFAKATRHPASVLAAAVELGAHLEGLRKAGEDVGGELSDAYVLQVEMAMHARMPAQAADAAERAVALRREALQFKRTPVIARRLVEALIMLGSVELGRGRDPAMMIAEAERFVPARPGRQTAWAPLIFKLQRMKGGIAQHEQRHGDAVEAFCDALRRLPAKLSSPDVMGVRLQVLGRLARSRLAIGQYAEAKAEARERQSLIEALQERIPPDARAVLRAGVLADLAALHAMTGRSDESDRGFAEALEIIDHLGGSDLGEARRQISGAWVEALIRQGRDKEAEALRSGSAPGHHARGSHGGKAGAHHHAHDHGNGSCSCCD